MSNKIGFFEEALESGVSTAKQGAKAVAKGASDTAKAAVSQMGIPTPIDQTNDDFVKDLYGPSNKKAQQNQQQQQQQPGNDSSNTPQTPEEAAKQAEEKKKMAELAAKLHDEVYYQPLINPRRDKPEERPAEKVEKEKEQEMVDLQKKEEKKPPPLVQRIQQRVEKFPGASG